jgi:Domain of unknown function (DUF397)
MADLASAVWHKSSYSGSNGGSCVEVAGNLPGIVAVRDSKNLEGGALTLTPAQWRGLLAGVKAGAFPV